jgi:hypothetical protein
MEVTHESHVAEIIEALEASGNATGVMLQIGTRNAELRAFEGSGPSHACLVQARNGSPRRTPNACEYIASSGITESSSRLRMKTNLGDLTELRRLQPRRSCGASLACRSASILRTQSASASSVPTVSKTFISCCARGHRGANAVLADMHQPRGGPGDAPQAPLPDQVEHSCATWSSSAAYLDCVELHRRMLG